MSLTLLLSPSTVVPEPNTGREDVWNPESYKALVDKLVKTIEFKGTTKKFKPPATAEDMFAAVQTALPELPEAFQKAYGRPLLAHKHDVLAALRRGEIDMMLLETLCGAVYERLPDFPEKKSLARYQTVLDSLYSSFMDKEKRAHLHLPVMEKLPPLAMFQSAADFGPFTIPVDALEQLIPGVKIAIVSLPYSYADHPVIWASLGHETGGHDILHAQTGLVQELARSVSEKFSHKYGDLFAYWIDETASDVYGLLNYGPAWAFNLGIFFGALNMAYGSPTYMRTVSYNYRGKLDPHPTDILRIGIAIGVTQSLTSLSQLIRDQYVRWLKEFAKFAAAGATEIKLQTRFGSFDSYPLDDMMAAAAEIGAYIATAQLKAFNGHSIQDIETWNSKDEQLMQDIAKQLAKEQDHVNTLLDFAVEHVISAGTIVALREPENYSRITKRLQSEVDVFVAKDKFWRGHGPLPVRLQTRPMYVQQPEPLWPDLAQPFAAAFAAM